MLTAHVALLLLREERLDVRDAHEIEIAGNGMLQARGGGREVDRFLRFEIADQAVQQASRERGVCADGGWLAR